MRGRSITLLLLLSVFASFGQQVQVRGGFVQDHFELGDEVQYFLTATYPEDINLIFPDSTYKFEPFEYTSKNYYPSKRLASGAIYDTAIYTLQCYEIDPYQSLKLPVTILLSNGDSTKIYAAADTILFHELAPAVSDTTSLKTNVAYIDVNTLFNFPLLWIILGILLIVSITVFLVFGKRIMKELKLKRLKKDYIKFSEELTAYIRQLKENPDNATAEKALVSWKAFAERMEEKPYSRMTTKEILGIGYTNELNDSLKSIDRSVYGGNKDAELFKHFQNIEDFTQHRYTVTVEEIKNTK